MKDASEYFNSYLFLQIDAKMWYAVDLSKLAMTQELMEAVNVSLVITEPQTGLVKVCMAQNRVFCYWIIELSIFHCISEIRLLDNKQIIFDK